MLIFIGNWGIVKCEQIRFVKTNLICPNIADIPGEGR